MKRYVSDKLRKLQILMDYPNALKARQAGCYFELFSEIYRLSARGLKPSTILDIGANRGMFSRCAHYIFPGAMIHAFEPLHDCYTELSHLQNQIPNMVCYQIALGESDGEAVIHRSSYDYSSSLLPMAELHKQAFPYTASERLEPIPVRTLDGLLGTPPLPRPLLVKIDVQGYELPVIRGGWNVLSKADYVICETSFVPLYSGQALFEDVYGAMHALGFRFRGQLGELTHPKSKAALQIDALFVREQIEDLAC